MSRVTCTIPFEVPAHRMLTSTGDAAMAVIVPLLPNGAPGVVRSVRAARSPLMRVQVMRSLDA